MRVLQKSEIIALESKALHAGISMSFLMGAAGAAVAEEAFKQTGIGSNVVVLCGKGNNGGDGFVAAQLLSDKGQQLTVILAQGVPSTKIAMEAYKQLKESVVVLYPEQLEECESALQKADLIIDAIFGFNFRGRLHGDAQELIVMANKTRAKKLAVDLPSGVECDSAAVYGIAFQAEITITFHACKPANLSYPAKEYCGETIVRELGISHFFLEESSITVTDDVYVKKELPVRNMSGNKGDFGKLLLICGSYGMAGACVLSARAALRSGIGLLYILVDQRIYSIVSAGVSEAVFFPVNMENRLELEQAIETALSYCTACVLGCGLGVLKDIMCGTVISRCKVPLLIDADGINYLSEHPNMSSLLSEKDVLTPHPGELSRLNQMTILDIQNDRLETTKKTAKRFNTVVLLKGAGTIISSPDGTVNINMTGNPGMATGGSGDVLSGIIGAYLAQGIQPHIAASIGAYVHGVAGDHCAKLMSMQAMLPSDLIETLPHIYKRYET